MSIVHQVTMPILTFKIEFSIAVNFKTAIKKLKTDIKSLTAIKDMWGALKHSGFYKSLSFR